MKLEKQRPVYWECTIDGHSKFWAAQIIENKTQTKTSYILIRKWGMIGTKGQRMDQPFYDRNEAENALDKLIWDKENKGYKSIF